MMFDSYIGAAESSSDSVIGVGEFKLRLKRNLKIGREQPTAQGTNLLLTLCGDEWKHNLEYGVLILIMSEPVRRRRRPPL
jgi:hypothetical protein